MLRIFSLSKSRARFSPFSIGRKIYLSSQNLPVVPVSSGNFRHIREKKAIYVDKTEILLNNMVSSDLEAKYHFLARPRRFGKSLLCSTIGEMFLGNPELFKGLYVQNKWDFEAEKCPVIHLDMSKLGRDVESILITISRRLVIVAKKYHVVLDTSLPINTQLETLIGELSTQFDRGVVVIIDEYDAPVLDLVDNPEQQKIMQEELSVFYGLLKAMDSHLRLVFITGIMRFSQMSLFSGLNNIVDMSLFPETSAICGYTEPELQDNFRPHLEALASKVKCGSTEKVVDILRSKFNGYCFGIADRETGTLCPTVYNPFAINYVMKTLEFSDKWVKSGHAKFLVQRIVDSKNLDGLIGEYKLPLRSLEGICTPSSMPVAQLKFCAGYSTISAYNPHSQEVTLKPPNDGVSHDMIEVLLDLAGAPMSLSSFLNKSQRITKTIFAGKAEESELCSLLHAAAIEFLPHQLFRYEKEAMFNLLFSILLQCGCDGRNYIYLGNELSVLTGDIELAIKHLPSNTVCIVEYKLHDSAEVALNQIKEKNFPMRFRDSNVILVGIQASKKSVNVTIEELPIHQQQLTRDLKLKM